MDVCSSYKYGNNIELERLSYRSKNISINIRISLLLSKEKVKHDRFQLFPPSRFSLLSSGRSLCFLPHFVSTASRNKREAKKIISTLSAMRNARVHGRLLA